MDKEPVDLFNERIRRRRPTDIGGVALTECLREAVAQERLSPEQATEYLQAYTNAYLGRPPDPAA